MGVSSLWLVSLCFVGLALGGCARLERSNVATLVNQQLPGQIARVDGIVRAMCNILPRQTLIGGSDSVVGVQLTNLRLTPSPGNNYVGSALVDVTGRAAASLAAADPRCDGTVYFEYEVTGRRSGRRSVSSSISLRNIVVVSRNGVPVNALTNFAEVTSISNIPRPQPLALGQTIEGTLERSDGAMADGSAVDAYAVTLTAGQPVTFVARGGAGAEGGPRLTAYLMLVSGYELVNADSGDVTTGVARIVYVPPVTGPFTVRVTTQSAGYVGGEYSVSLLPGALPSAS